MVRSLILFASLLTFCQRTTIEPAILTSVYLVNYLERPVFALIVPKNSIIDTIKLDFKDTMQIGSQRSSGWLKPSDMLDSIIIVDSSYNPMTSNITQDTAYWNVEKGNVVKWFYIINGSLEN